jgi:hypothetical protein
MRSSASFAGTRNHHSVQSDCACTFNRDTARVLSTACSDQLVAATYTQTASPLHHGYPSPRVHPSLGTRCTPLTHHTPHTRHLSSCTAARQHAGGLHNGLEALPDVEPATVQTCSAAGHHLLWCTACTLGNPLPALITPTPHTQRKQHNLSCCTLLRWCYLPSLSCAKQAWRRACPAAVAGCTRGVGHAPATTLHPTAS